MTRLFGSELLFLFVLCSFVRCCLLHTLFSFTCASQSFLLRCSFCFIRFDTLFAFFASCFSVAPLCLPHRSPFLSPARTRILVLFLCLTLSLFYCWVVFPSKGPSPMIAAFFTRRSKDEKKKHELSSTKSGCALSHAHGQPRGARRIQSGGLLPAWFCPGEGSKRTFKRCQWLLQILRAGLRREFPSRPGAHTLAGQLRNPFILTRCPNLYLTQEPIERKERTFPQNFYEGISFPLLCFYLHSLSHETEIDRVDSCRGRIGTFSQEFCVPGIECGFLPLLPASPGLFFISLCSCVE